MNTLMNLIDRASTLLAWGSRLALVALTGAMLYEVIARYAFNASTIWAFDLDSHEKVGELKTENYVWSLNATSDDKPLLLGVNIEGGLDVFDLSKMEYMHTVEGISAIPALVLSSH